MTQRRIPRVSRVPPSLRETRAAQKVWKIASHVRGRGDWLASSASYCRNWQVKLDGETYRIAAYTSAFLDALETPKPRHPAWVYSLTIHSTEKGRPIREKLLQTAWLRGLASRLGGRYWLDDIAVRPEEVRFSRVLRGTSEPERLLREFAHVSTSVEGGRSSGPNSRREFFEKKTPAQREKDFWSFAQTMRRRAQWLCADIDFNMKRLLHHERCRWHASVMFGARVHSSKGVPGTVGMLDAFSVNAGRLKRRKPTPGATRLLVGAGYRRAFPNDDYVHNDRWKAGLDLGFALQEVELLERAMGLVMARRD